MDRCIGLLSGVLIVCLASFGCEPGGGGYKTAKEIKTAKGTAGHDDHEHGAAGPHGGAIVELGDEEYHGEVVVDAKSHTLTVYLFGPDAKTAAPISAGEVTVETEDDKSLTLKAVDAKDGKASQFRIDDEAKVEAIVDAGYLHGTLKLETDGKQYRGAIDAHFDGSEHGDEKHKDEKHEDEKRVGPAGSDDSAKSPDEKASDDEGTKDEAKDSGEEKTDAKAETETSDIPDPPATPE